MTVGGPVTVMNVDEGRSAHREVPGLNGTAQRADLMGTSRRRGRPNGAENAIVSSIN